MPNLLQEIRADLRQKAEIGADARQGFALILHEPGAPPTTLTSDWTPKGLCPGR